MNLEINNLNKQYKNFSLNNININVPKGKIVGFIGENGSGKTTTIKAILNLIKIDNGNIKIFNKNINKLTKKDKELIGVVLDDSFFSNILKVDDINNLMKHFYSNWDESLYYEYINEFKLPKNLPFKEYSSGMKMKLKVICAISHKPKLLILDEPTNGLDPIFRYEILNIFEKFVSNKENSIFMSSHITSDLDYVADNIVLINNGNILLDMKKDELFNKYGVVECNIEDFKNIDTYTYNLKYKDIYLLFIEDKNTFNKKYPKLIINKPTIEQLLLLFIKGEKNEIN